MVDDQGPLTRPSILFPRALILLVLLASLGACEPPGSSDAVGDSPLRGSIIETGGVRPHFTLSDTDGNPYSFATETDGLLAFIFFGYTNCPDVCPIHMATLASAIGRLDPADRGRVRVVFITVDPLRDTPEVLRRWLDSFDRGFVGLRGTLDEVNAVAESLLLPPAAVPEDAGDSYIVGHAASVLAVTPDGGTRVKYAFGTRQEDWAADLPLLLQWDGRAR